MENQVSPGFLDFIGRFQTLFREKFIISTFNKKKSGIKFEIYHSYKWVQSNSPLSRDEKEIGKNKREIAWAKRIFRNAEFDKGFETRCRASRKYFLVRDFGRDG